jgi:hypothetical protein
VEMAMPDDRHATTDDRWKHDGVRVVAGYFAVQSNPDRVGAYSRRSRGAHGSPPATASPIRVRSESASTVAKSSACCRAAWSRPEAAILVLRALVRMLRMYVG